jgi:hypothetical protein
MFYVTYRKPRKISTKLMDRAVAFASEYLELDSEYVEIDFEGEFGDCCGYCEYEDRELTVHINPKLSVEQILLTLFHELVHAKQFVKGSLRMGVGLKPSRWKGRDWTETRSYDDLPWEQEAHELEKVMWDLFKTVDIRSESV